MAKKAETVEEMDAETLKAFVKKNEAKIVELLKEAPSKIEKKVDKGKDVAKGVFEAAMSKDVQQHFMKAGMEFMLGMAELMKAMPIPDDIKSMVKNGVKKDCADCEGPAAKKKSAPKKKSIEKIELT